MAQIGNLGDFITFEVSSQKVLTFRDLNRTVSGRWAKHDVLTAKPRSEFLGPELQKMSLTIQVSAVLGVKPRKVIDAIAKATEQGTPFTFVLGNRKIGKYQWVIESVSETWGEIIDDGRLLSANLSLSLTEYVPI